MSSAAATVPSAATAFPLGAGSPPLPSRAAPRLSFEAVVRLSCAGRRGIHTGFVRDVSSGGMFLRLVDPEPPGRRLGFELFLPGWRTPARGVAEVVWQRPSYEGPGRPPGMAIRFVALEARAIEMLAAVLPGGEAPEVEVLQPRPLPPVRRDERPAPVGVGRRAAKPTLVGAIGGSESAPAWSAGGEPSLETLLADSGLATPAPIAAARSASSFSRSDLSAAADLDDDGPMIFVPPPPAQLPLLPEAKEPAKRPAGHVASRLRWGSAAAGIAAVASLATLVVVGAARFDTRPSAEHETPARRGEQPAPRQQSAVPLVPARAAANGAPTAGDGPAMAPARSQAESPPLTAPPSVSVAVADSNTTVSIATPATRLTGLRWEPLPTGGTRMTIALDGSFSLSRLRASRIGGDAPRLVVRLLGLGAGVPRAPWEPSTPEVRRIRAGRHDGEGGAEIHLVLDLANPMVRMVRSEVAGTELRLDLATAPADAVR